MTSFATTTSTFASSFARLNTVVALAIIGVSIYIFYNLSKNVALGRTQIKAEIAALCKDVEQIKALLGIVDGGGADGGAEAEAKAKKNEPVAVITVETRMGGGVAADVKMDDAEEEVTSDDGEDEFEVVSIISNEIKDLLGNISSTVNDVLVNVNDDNDDDNNDDNDDIVKIVDKAAAEASSNITKSDTEPAAGKTVEVKEVNVKDVEAKGSVKEPAATSKQESKPDPETVKAMKLEDLRDLAKSLGLDQAKATKSQLISKILAVL